MDVRGVIQQGISRKGRQYQTWGTLQIRIQFVRQSRNTNVATLETNKQDIISFKNPTHEKTE